MNILGKLCAAVFALGLASSAMAAVTLHDVEIVVKKDKDYVKGEALMRDLVASDTGNARYHYIFAQILDKNGKHDEALREFNTMKQLDPSYSFEKDPSHVAVFGDKLANETAHSAVRSPAPTPVAPPPAMRAETHSMPPPPAVPSAPQKSGHMLLWVVLIMIVVCVGGWFMFRRNADKDRVEEEARTKTLRQDQLKQANSLLESVKPLRLDMRMASPPNTALLAELDDAEKQLIDLIERLSKNPVSQREIDVQSDNLTRLRRKFEGKADPAPSPAPAPEPEPQGNTVYQGNSGTGFGMPQQVNNGMNTVYQPAGYQPGYQPGYPMQQPVIVEQESGLGAVGGLIAGVALGEMLSGGHRDREVIREIHEVREVHEVPVYEDRPSRSDSSSDIDFGDSNSSSSSSSNDVDFDDSNDN